MTNKQTIVISSAIAKKRALSAVNACMGDNIQQVTIEPYQHNRTLSQLRWWHKMISLLADEIGYTPAEMKDILKDEILGLKVIEWNGEPKEIHASSEDCKRHGYSKLIDETYRIAAEQGCVLPQPNYKGD